LERSSVAARSQDEGCGFGRWLIEVLVYTGRQRLCGRYAAAWARVTED
jgi:hypothetical protein